MSRSVTTIALRRGQLVERGGQVREHRRGGQTLLDLLGERDRRLGPAAVRGEAGGVLRAGVVGVVERHRPTLAARDRPRLVDQDRVEPGLQRRTPLEAIEAAQHPDPRLLHDLLGDAAVGHERLRDADHRGVMRSDQARKRLFITPPEARDQLKVVHGGPSYRTRSRHPSGEPGAAGPV